jgi:hypothetical protein
VKPDKPPRTHEPVPSSSPTVEPSTAAADPSPEEGALAAPVENDTRAGLTLAVLAVAGLVGGGFILRRRRGARNRRGGP